MWLDLLHDAGQLVLSCYCSQSKIKVLALNASKLCVKFFCMFLFLKVFISGCCMFTLILVQAGCTLVDTILPLLQAKSQGHSTDLEFLLAFVSWFVSWLYVGVLCLLRLYF